MMNKKKLFDLRVIERIDIEHEYIVLKHFNDRSVLGDKQNSGMKKLLIRLIDAEGEKLMH